MHCTLTKDRIYTIAVRTVASAVIPSRALTAKAREEAVKEVMASVKK